VPVPTPEPPHPAVTHEGGSAGAHGLEPGGWGSSRDEDVEGESPAPPVPWDEALALLLEEDPLMEIRVCPPGEGSGHRQGEAGANA
jgi:hypothetical protein